MPPRLRFRARISPVTLLAVLVTAGCGGAAWSPQIQPGPSAASPDNIRGRLLYVTEPYANAVLIYSYPQLQLQSTLRVAGPEGLCVDKRNGNVWVVSYSLTRSLIEFRHGGIRPIARIHLGTNFIASCAVDPVTGDLAVPDNLGHGLRGGIIVYGSKIKSYENSRIYDYDLFAAYDDASDLFADANVAHYPAVLAELRSGGRRLHLIPIQRKKLYGIDAMQFDGHSMAVARGGRSEIFQTFRGVVTGSTALDGACHIGQFFIDDGRVIVPSTCGPSSQSGNGALLIYAYPAGGKPIGRITGLNSPFAAAVTR